MKYAFNILRGRARQRGHSFDLTFAEYESFALQTGYAELKGKTKHSLSIDRKNPALGYHRDNIRAITLSLNSRLRFAKMPDYLREEMIEAEKASMALAATN